MKLQKLKNVVLDDKSYIYYDICNFVGNVFLRRYTGHNRIRYYLFLDSEEPGKQISELKYCFDTNVDLFETIIKNTEKKK